MAGVGLLTRIAKVAATLCLLTIAKHISGVGRDATVIGGVAAESVLPVFSTITRACDICDGKVSFRLENPPIHISPENRKASTAANSTSQT
jgi:hypothetical protein